MNIIKLTICFILIAVSMSSIARKPAVEDFVGVETVDYKPTDASTHVLFNFGNFIQKQSAKNLQNQQSFSFFNISVLAAFISLPFLMWYGIKISTDPKQTLDPTSEIKAANVEHLDKYRNENKDKDDIKKAS